MPRRAAPWSSRSGRRGPIDGGVASRYPPRRARTSETRSNTVTRLDAETRIGGIPCIHDPASPCRRIVVSPHVHVSRLPLAVCRWHVSSRATRGGVILPRSPFSTSLLEVRSRHPTRTEIRIMPPTESTETPRVTTDVEASAAKRAGIDPCRCPICGATNDCGLARGENTCWCFDLRIPPEVLEKVPPESRGVVCICRACAAGHGPSPVPGGALGEASEGTSGGTSDGPSGGDSDGPSARE